MDREDPRRRLTRERSFVPDVTYHRARQQGTVRVAFNRPECRATAQPASLRRE